MGRNVYIVELVERFTKSVAIHANSEEEAVAKAHSRYEDGEYDLSCDYDTARFSANVTEITEEDD